MFTLEVSTSSGSVPCGHPYECTRVVQAPYAQYWFVTYNTVTVYKSKESKGGLIWVWHLFRGKKSHHHIKTKWLTHAKSALQVKLNFFSIYQNIRSKWNNNAGQSNLIGLIRTHKHPRSRNTMTTVGLFVPGNVWYASSLWSGWGAIIITMRRNLFMI